MKKFELELNLIKFAQKLDNFERYKQSDNIFLKLAQSTPEVFKQGTEMKPGLEYEVQGNQSEADIITKVATSGIPDHAMIDGTRTLVTHGSSDGNFWLLPDSQANIFFNSNPDFKNNNTISEVDQSAGIQAVMDSNKLWVNAQGMSKYAGSKWIACNNLNNGANFGQIGGAKGTINVGTQKTPEGDKLILTTDK